jgi:hypothetical protein
MASKGEGEAPEMSLEEWLKAFMSMKEMLEALYYQNHPNEEYESSIKGEGGGEGEYPFELSSPSSGNGANRNYSKNSSHTHNVPPSHKTLLKLDVKFNLTIYDGELNVENLYNYVKQIEVYCRVQKIK